MLAARTGVCAYGQHHICTRVAPFVQVVWTWRRLEPTGPLSQRFRTTHIGTCGNGGAGPTFRITYAHGSPTGLARLAAELLYKGHSATLIYGVSVITERFRRSVLLRIRSRQTRSANRSYMR